MGRCCADVSLPLRGFTGSVKVIESVWMCVCELVRVHFVLV